jgi:hypothetical protein
LCGAAGDVTDSTTGRSSSIIGRSSRFIVSIIGRSFTAGGSDGADAAAAVSAANNASDVNGVKTTPPITDGMA